MIFTDDAVDIPERLIDSLTKNRLVVFGRWRIHAGLQETSAWDRFILDSQIWLN